MSTRETVRTMLQNATPHHLPHYQRGYSWDLAQWRGLFNDVIRVSQKSPRTDNHYLGAIHLKNHELLPDTAKQMVLLVIDGWQRFATLSILIIVFRDHLVDLLKQAPYADESDEVRASNERHLASAINMLRGLVAASHDDILIPGKVTVTPKIKAGLRDRLAYEAMVRADSAVLANCQEHQMMKAYTTFRRLLEKHLGARTKAECVTETKKLISALLDGFDGMPIKLSVSEDGFLVFLNINSESRRTSLTNLDYFQSDLTRHAEEIGVADPEEYRHLHWDPTMAAIRRAAPAALQKGDRDARLGFIRFMLSEDNGSFFAIDQIGPAFTKWLQPARDEAALTACMLQLKAAAKRYLALLTGVYDGDAALRAPVRDIANLGAIPAMALAFATLGRVDANTLSVDDAATVLTMVSSVSWRRWLTRGDIKTMLRVLPSVMAAFTDPEATAEAMLDELLRRVTVPTDDEVVRAGLERPMDTSSDLQKRAVYLLRLLEEQQWTGDADLRREISPTITLEHLMPQTLNDAWRKDLSPDDIAKHAQVNGVFGNLSLVNGAKNSGMGNAGWQTKRPKLAKSPSLINQAVATEETWNVEAIRRNTDKAYRTLLPRWPMPASLPQVGSYLVRCGDKLLAAKTVREAAVLLCEDAATDPETRWADVTQECKRFVCAPTHDQPKRQVLSNGYMLYRGLTLKGVKHLCRTLALARRKDATFYHIVPPGESVAA